LIRWHDAAESFIFFLLSPVTVYLRVHHLCWQWHAALVFPEGVPKHDPDETEQDHPSSVGEEMIVEKESDCG